MKFSTGGVETWRFFFFSFIFFIISHTLLYELLLLEYSDLCVWRIFPVGSISRSDHAICNSGKDQASIDVFLVNELKLQKDPINFGVRNHVMTTETALY